MPFDLAAFADSLFQLAADASDLGCDDSPYAKAVAAGFRGLAAAVETAGEAGAAEAELRRILDGATALASNAGLIRAGHAACVTSLSRADAKLEKLATDLATMDAARGAAVRETEAMRRSMMAAVGDSTRYREQRDSEGARATAASARADKAERQLAEYRSLIGRVTYGAGLRDESIMALGRAYLNDMESSK